MRRPHVYERSAPRSPRGAYHEPHGDPVSAARDIAYALVGLLTKAELCGLSGLAGALQRALDEAEAADGSAAAAPRPART